MMANFVKVPEEPETEELVSLPQVREAQKLTGELLWLSGKTRPDIAWAVMKLFQNTVKKPKWTLDCRAVLTYIKHTVGYGVHYTYRWCQLTRLRNFGGRLDDILGRLKSLWMPRLLQRAQCHGHCCPIGGRAYSVGES